MARLCAVRRMVPSSTGGSRTHTPQGLSLSALPVGAPCHSTPAPLAGFEPAASTLTKWRALLTAPQGRVSNQSARRESNPLIRLGKAAGQPLHHGRVESSVSAKPQAGVEPARPSDQTASGRDITGAVGDRCRQCPRQESNLVFNLRRVACGVRHTPRTVRESTRRELNPGLRRGEPARSWLRHKCLQWGPRELNPHFLGKSQECYRYHQDPVSRPSGNRTPTSGLKARRCRR